MHRGGLEHLPGLYKAVEFVVRHEEVVDPVHLARSRRSRRRRDREMHVRVVLADVGGDRALADRGRPREHDETRWRRRMSTVLAMFEPLQETATLPHTETADSLRFGDAQLFHRPGRPRRSETRNARQELAHPEARLRCRRRIRPGSLDHLDRTARAVVDGPFDRGTSASRGDGGVCGRRAVDIGRGYTRHSNTSRAAVRTASAMPWGPA